VLSYAAANGQRQKYAELCWNQANDHAAVVCACITVANRQSLCYERLGSMMNADEVDAGELSDPSSLFRY